MQTWRKRKKKVRAYSPNIHDYPSTMSQYERESLADEAKLKAKTKPTERKSRKPSSQQITMTGKPLTTS